MSLALFRPGARRGWQTGFFLLFLLAPALDAFRLDLSAGHFWFLGMRWTLGLHELAGAGGLELTGRLLLRAGLPVLGFVALVLWLVWRFGRIYCGWLCPHFLVVEWINGVMRRASGKPSLWERRPLPEQQADGTRIRPHPAWWLGVVLAVVGFALLWAVTLLTYLLPPERVWTHLLQGQLTAGEQTFIGVATALLVVEFSLARHLFCRYGCAVGLFQSLAWMGNGRAWVVGFDRNRAAECAACDASCDHACPMRIHPRHGKRLKFTCTQCQSCIQACERVQARQGRPALLRMVSGSCAEAEAAFGLGRNRGPTPDCFREGS